MFVGAEDGMVCISNFALAAARKEEYASFAGVNVVIASGKVVVSIDAKLAALIDKKDWSPLDASSSRPEIPGGP